MTPADTDFLLEPWVRHGEAEMTIVRLLDVQGTIELRVGGRGHVWGWRADAPPNLSRKGTAESAEAAKAAALGAARTIHRDLRAKKSPGN
jgi:hypothetical protein